MRRQRELLPCPYCTAAKRVHRIAEVPRVRLPNGLGSEIASWAAELAAEGGSAPAFGAGFLFTVQGSNSKNKAYSDTSQSTHQLPFFEYDTVVEMKLPDHCQLVGIELIDGAVELPTFKHPVQAAYVLGPEKGNLSAEMLNRCDHVIKIPTSFCINVATAGAIVMYDRVVSLGRFGQRATFSRNAGNPPPAHVQGTQKFRHPK